VSVVRQIARDEARYWRRSQLAVAASVLFLLLAVVTLVVTALRISHETTLRAHHQAEAEAAFLAQPDRHPHRMIHYGHFVFRTPPPLARFDPGIDAVTGSALFLEGHRQNSASFAEAGASAYLGGLSWLTPALVYQLFAPLLLIILGHGALAREREGRTLQALASLGITPGQLVLGKGLALGAALGLALVPLVLTVALGVGAGEALGPALGMIGAYALYLGLWAGLALLFSSVLAERGAVLVALTALWLALTLLLPSLAVNNTERLAPLEGKTEGDLALLSELRKLGDGHNAADPAFAKLKQDLLDQYNVDSVEALPVNFRGLVATKAEADLTETMNRFAEARMRQEAAQNSLLARHGWLSPLLALAEASRALAGTDLANHHRFLREAEALRFDFVQRLNGVHAEALSYRDDVRRSSDPEAEARTRVSGENWQVLQAFRFEPQAPAARLAAAGESLLILLVWCLGLMLALKRFAGRLAP
jgi:ABC-2 type transport system permease protein